MLLLVDFLSVVKMISMKQCHFCLQGTDYPQLGTHILVLRVRTSKWGATYAYTTYTIYTEHTTSRARVTNKYFYFTFALLLLTLAVQHNKNNSFCYHQQRHIFFYKRWNAILESYE